MAVKPIIWEKTEIFKAHPKNFTANSWWASGLFKCDPRKGNYEFVQNKQKCPEKCLLSSLLELDMNGWIEISENIEPYTKAFEVKDVSRLHEKWKNWKL